MPKERLTESKVDMLKASAKETIYRDTESHLVVRVRPTGSKTYEFRSTLRYREIRIRIAETTAKRLIDARILAREWQELVDQGIDPRQAIKDEAARLEAEQGAAMAAMAAEQAERDRQARYTLAALCDAYVNLLERSGKGKSAAETKSTFRCHVFNRPEIAELPAREVTAHHIAALVRKVREAGKERAAGLLRTYLMAAFNIAKRAPFDSALPADLIPFCIEHNPVDPVPAVPVKRGDRTLSAVELRDYIKVLGDGLPDMALKLALFAGGQRMAQLLRAKVSDYNPENATLRLLDSKGKRSTPREHLLPLGPKAAALVERLVERAAGKESPLLFLSETRNVAMTFETPGKRVAEIAAGMGGESFDLKDLRRTVETMLAEMGISRDTRAHLLSHGISGVQAAHYDRHTYTDEKRAALVAWEARLEAIEKGTPAPANVVRLRTA